MNWVEKFERLRGSRSYAAIERDAGITRNTLARATRDASNLSMVTAMRLAQYLNVSADWLFNDQRDWPPPATENVSLDDPAFRDAVMRIVAEALQGSRGSSESAEPTSGDKIQRHRTTPMDPNAKTLDDFEPQTEVGKRLKRWAKKKVAESKAAKSAKKGRRGA